jgi:hypothetical protein
MLAAMVFLGCTHGSSPLLGISYEARGPYADLALFRAEITQISQRRVFSGADLTLRTGGADFLTAERENIRLVAGAPVTVRLGLVESDTDTLALASVSWSPELDWSYNVGAVAGPQRPLGFCFAIAAALALPPRLGRTGDTLFVLRTGLPKDAVC